MAISINDLAIRYPLTDEEKEKNRLAECARNQKIKADRLAGEEILQRLLPEERESYLSYSNYGNQFHIGNQYLRFSPRHYDAWMAFESWDTVTAVKLITIGYPLDLSNTDWIDGSETSRTFNKVYSKALSLAESSIARGKLKAIDTPFNWIAWAKSQDYSTGHLNPLGIIQSFRWMQSQIDYENCNESYREKFKSYQEGIEGWQKIADIWGLTMAEPTPPQAETVGNAGASSQAVTEPADVKKETSKSDGRNQKRTKILNAWYVALCTEHKNNSEFITEEINRLTNDEIKKELANLTPKDDKHIWTNGADRWIKDNGASEWGFKKTQGGKPKPKE